MPPSPLVILTVCGAWRDRSSIAQFGDTGGQYTWTYRGLQSALEELSMRLVESLAS